MENRERERTGIGSLKVRFNRVFGYYIEISKSNLHAVPDDYHRKQTIAGGERFTTPALKEYEEKVLGADERIVTREIEIFERLRASIAAEAPRIQESARALATLDVLKQPGVYEQVFRTGRTLMSALSEILRKAGIKATVVGEPPLFDVLFTDASLKDYRDTLKGDKAIAAKFNKLLRERGLMKGESKYYVSLAHTQADIDHTIRAWTEAARDLAR